MSSSLENVLARDFPAAVSQKKELSALLENFERGIDRSVSTQQTLESMTWELTEKIERMEDLFLRGETSLKPVVRDLWKRRLRNLRSDANLFRMSLKTQLDHIYKMRQKDDRKRLFSDSSGLNKRREVADAISAFTDERTKLKESSYLLDSMLKQGEAVVGSIIQQNNILKSAQKKIRSFGTSLAVSVGIITSAERRHGVDRMIVYACIIFNVLLFAILYYVVKIWWKQSIEVQNMD